MMKRLFILALLLWPSSAWADTRTLSVAGGNWNTAATWVEVAVPTAASDVVMLGNGLSGPLTIDGTSGSPSLARSVNFTNYSGTLTWAASKELDVGDGGGGSLIFVSGMTTSPSSTSILKMLSTTTGNTVTFAGKVLGLVTWNGSGGAWNLTDNPNTSRDYTFTAGTVTFATAWNGHAFTCNGGTVNATSGTITLTATSSVAGCTFNAAGQTMIATSFTASSGSYTVGTHTGSGSFTDSGGTVTFGAGGATATSMAYSAGTTTSSGTVQSSSGSVTVSSTGTLDATGQSVIASTSVGMTSTGSFKAAAVTAGTTCTHSAGTWQTTGNVACTTFTGSGSTLRTLSMGTGTTWTMSGTGNAFSFSTTPTNLTFTPGTSKIIISDTSATTKTVNGGGQTFYDLQINGAASAGAVTINQTNTFHTLTLAADSNVKLASTATQTLTSLSAAGTSGHTIALTSTTGASAAILSVPAAAVTMNYVSGMQDITIGPDAVYAGANSTSTSGNTGWIFGAKPTSGQHFVAGM